MMKSEKITMTVLFVLLFLFFQNCGLCAVDRLKLKEGFKPGSHHLELRDLGCEGADLIAADESAITSLVEADDGNIYGGTTGSVCHLFVFSISLNRVKHLGKIEGQESIHHSIVSAGDGMVYFGTGLNELEQHPISEPPPGNMGIVTAMWADIEKRYSGYEGGHLYRFDISKEKREWIDPQEKCIAEDLGAPVRHNGIYALTINSRLGEIYGISYPDGHFFVYNIETKKFADIGEVYKEKIFGGPDNRGLRSITSALICDKDDFVYGSTDDGVIFRYDPRKGKIENLPLKIPAIYYSVVEAFARDENGTIYGGTSEGYLFRFEPEKMKLANLGKPLAQWRIRGLAVGKNCVLYGIAGQRNDHCQLFSYNLAENEFNDLGTLKVAREPYYSWVAFQTDSILAAKDGVIYIGESERKSHLFLFYP